MEIDIVDKYDFVERYNEKKISSVMLEYIIEQAKWVEKNDKIKIIINKKCPLQQQCSEMIKEGLKEEYSKSLKKRHDNNIEQLFFLCLGIIFIFLSSLIKEETIWKELLLISGWVPIWEMVEVELFSDTEERKRRAILRKLLKSEIIEKESIFELKNT